MASKNTVTLTGGGGLDTRDFSRFAKALRRQAPDMAVTLRKELRAAGEIVAADARARASFSSKIPASIKTRVSGATISIVAGSKKAADAAPYENEGKQGDFRHPLFGNRAVWISQKAHPFLHPALEAGRPAVMDAALQALDRAVDQVTRDTDA